MRKTSLLIILSLVLMPLLNNCKDKKATDQDENATKVDSTATEKTALSDEPPAVNTLSEKEKEEGWILLFDGKTTDGWRGYKKDHFPNGWTIDDQALHCKGSGRGEAGSKEGGDIIYDKKFDNFTLKLDWKISEGGNSGIFYLGQEELDYIWKTAPEMQVLDNEKHPDAKLGKDGNRQAGSLYDLIPAKPQNAKPAGGWNEVEITVYKGTVVHKQNGENVVEYHLWTPEWKELVSGSKFPELNKDWAEVASEGYIGLQDHGDDVWFRNIKLKKL
ncbi:MAG: glycosyl hydrolase [Flavobacteriales bacterium]|nr:MAG: glycosyl hydrolase [Flavobacteriales bacterium]